MSEPSESTVQIRESVSHSATYIYNTRRTQFKQVGIFTINRDDLLLLVSSQVFLQRFTVFVMNKAKSHLQTSMLHRVVFV